MLKRKEVSMPVKNKNSSGNNIARLILIIGLVSTVLFATTSCVFLPRVLRGSGNIISEERDVKDFNKVTLTGVGNLIIEQGDEESLTIEAEDNILPKIITQVRNGELSIGFVGGITPLPTEDIKFHLKAKDLDRIALTGTGVISCSEFNTDDLEFDLSGAGEVNFKIAVDTIKTLVSGFGTIILTGDAGKQEVKITGAGSYLAKDLISRECDVTISGAGSATVNVSEKLNVVISGAGSVNYIGNPEISQKMTGPGSIKNISE
jgi:hypothetical protein